MTLAKRIYQQAADLPSTSTNRRLIDAGISVLERCSKSDTIEIIYAHNAVGASICLKRLANADEVDRLTYLVSLEIDCPCIVKFKFVDGTNFLLMPRLVSNLMEVNALFPEAQISICNDMISAVEYLHHLHVAHMDIKPENIGITMEGKFVLIDIGNAAQFGIQTYVTDKFVPLDFTVIRGSMPAQPVVDFGLIATTLLFKLSSTTTPVPREKRLVDILVSLTDFGCVGTVVEMLRVKLQSFQINC